MVTFEGTPVIIENALQTAGSRLLRLENETEKSWQLTAAQSALHFLYVLAVTVLWIACNYAARQDKSA